MLEMLVISAILRTGLYGGLSLVLFAGMEASEKNQ